jgi:hypothetical protein
LQAGDLRPDSLEKLEQVGSPEAGNESEDENPERGNWSGKYEFLLSLMGYAVGDFFASFVVLKFTIAIH